MTRFSSIATRISLTLAMCSPVVLTHEPARAQATAAPPAALVTGEQGKKLGGPKSSTVPTTANQQAGEPTKAEDSAWMLRTAASLAGVIVLIFGVAFVVKKVARQQGGLMASLGPGGRAPSGLLEVLGRYPVARGTTLVLLKLDRRVLLVCQTTGRRLGPGTSMNTLSEITDADEVASILVKSRDEEGESLAKKFESMLGSFGGKSATVTVESKPVSMPRPASGLAEMLRGGSKSKPTVKPAAPAKPLTKAQAIATLEARLQTLRTQGSKEKAA